jgi:hypothetical protein
MCHFVNIRALGKVEKNGIEKGTAEMIGIKKIREATE